MSDGGGRIIPLVIPEIDLSKLPEPLSRLQALSLGKADQIKVFFQGLSDEFGCGSMKGFKGSSIKSQIPKYDNLKIDNKDINLGEIYSGPYEGYSQEEMMEVIDEYIDREQLLYREKHSIFLVQLSPKKTFLTGQLIHYRHLDEKLQLPHGTAKKLLITVASRYYLEPIQELENSVRLAYIHN